MPIVAPSLPTYLCQPKVPCISTLTRALYSTDASLYRVVPQGVVLWKVGLVMGAANLCGGYIGARSVKWLSALTLQEEPSDNYFQSKGDLLISLVALDGEIPPPPWADWPDR